MKKKLFLVVLTVVFISCKKADFPAGPNLFFVSPQPINDSELDHFPAKFRGLFIDKDSTFLSIDENVAKYEYYYKFIIHKNQLDSLGADFILKEGNLTSKEFNKTFDVYPKGDSLLLVEKKTDTLFRFSYYQKAKRINGHLILSTKDSIFWTIKNLSIEKNNIVLKNICLDSDVRKIDSVTAIKAAVLDSGYYLLKPTRREFVRILKIQNLGYQREFKRIKI